MKRRDLLKTGIGVVATGAWAADVSATTQPAGPLPPSAHSAMVLAGYTEVQHRQRLLNIRACERGVRRCLRKHLVTDYLPGQCCYNLGEYPARKIWDPDGWDETELDLLRAQGIDLIQVHEEWNDALRLFGGDKLSSANDAGFRRFVERVHRRGMKLIVYISTGFFPRKDRDFQARWAGPNALTELYWEYASCSPASPGWRTYLLPRLVQILDAYGVDGFYNDLGYGLWGSPLPPVEDEVRAFEERADFDGALGDLLALIYAEVKRRGGIVKIHHSAANRPMTELRVYDYLWVGETMANADALREAVKNHPPYVVPCVDLSRAKIASEDELYLHAIPYMQFPLLLAGRPFTGERGVVPGIQYAPEDPNSWTQHVRNIWRRHQAHPEGPHSYGWWDSVPGRPEARPTHARWLRLYRPMVEEGTRAYLEIADSDFTTEALPAGVVLSAFANRELYLVVANYNRDPAKVALRGAWTPADGQAGSTGPERTLAGRTLRILRREAATSPAGA